jgi:hypothetical protein
MPDWCQNFLEVESPGRHRLERFSAVDDFATKSRTEEQPLIFSGLVPEPGDPNDPSFDWYAWRVLNWGCKWEPTCYGEPTDTETGLRYEFDTPWEPPREWVQKVSELYPDLQFTLESQELPEGQSWRLVYRGGVLVADPPR